MDDTSDARERVLETAEQLFRAKGYNGVSMRDIAEALGMRQASLYYHVPEGKEKLYIEVMERSLIRHQKGLQEAIATAESTVEAQLSSAAQWLIDQSPLKMMSTFESDMPAISPGHALALTSMAYDSLFGPINCIFHEAQKRGEVRLFDPKLLSGAFLSIMDSIGLVSYSDHSQLPLDEIGKQTIEILLNGLRTC